jgi:nucleoid-associated protein YgaU
MNTSRTLPALALAAFALALHSGCSTVPLTKDGEMQATFVAGEFRMLVNADTARTVQATGEAFQQMGLFEVGREVRTFDASLSARTPKDEKVRVSIREVNSRQTELRIRVDVTGDRNFSRKLYERIESNLGGSSPARAGAGGASSSGTMSGW